MHRIHVNNIHFELIIIYIANVDPMHDNSKKLKMSFIDELTINKYIILFIVMENQLSMSVQTLSSIISSMTTTSMLTNNTTQSRETTEAIRGAYEKIIILDNWKDKFEKIADGIINNIIKDMAKTHATTEFVKFDTVITIACSAQLYDFDLGKKCITIGTNKNCDIELLGNLGCSRLHTMLFPLPQLGIFVLIDLGSATGIKTRKRSSQKQLINSLPNQRNVLIFDWNEIVVLDLGNQIIAINPKTCVICFEKPRNKQFGCGHYSTCNVCSAIINFCPICLKPKKEMQETYAIQTNNK